MTERVLVTLAACVLAGCIGTPAELAPIVGNPAPDFAVETIDGETWRLSDQAGRVVVLDLMGVHCAPCRAAMPHLRDVHEAHAGDGLAMLSVDMGSVYPALGSDDPDELRAFRDAFNATWAFAVDRGAKVGPAFQPIAVPTLVVIDGEGIIRAKLSGAIVDSEQVEAAMAEAGSVA